MDRKIVAYEWTDYGVDHAQYFQGVGISYTEWTSVNLGAGSTADEAAESALESAASSGWNVSNIALPTDLSSGDAHAECSDDDDMCELYHYVALYVKGEV